MTEELFREDATLLQCEAQVLAVDEWPDGSRAVVLDRTVFYPLGGGQAGDTGMLCLADGREVSVADTRKHKDRPGGLAHLLAPGADATGLVPGASVTARIDADRRRAHMRFHTATHLLSAIVPPPGDGSPHTAGYSRPHLPMHSPLDKRPPPPRHHA